MPRLVQMPACRAQNNRDGVPPVEDRPGFTQNSTTTMSTWHLVLREIGYRKGNFLWSVLAVGVAAACVAAALSLVERYNERTKQLAAEQQAELKQKMAALEDDYRKIMLGLGFNVLILPKDQKLDDFYADDYATKLMPEEYVERLILRPGDLDQSRAADLAAEDRVAGTAADRSAYRDAG